MVAASGVAKGGDAVAQQIEGGGLRRGRRWRGAAEGSEEVTTRRSARRGLPRRRAAAAEELRGGVGCMEALNQTKFYQLGNGGNLIYERDLDALSVHLGRPHPEFFGTQVNDQPGGELQWVIVADLRGRMEPSTSERIHFTIRESNWLDGLARTLQEALALPPRAEAPRGAPGLYAAREKEQDNSRIYANQTHLHLSQQIETIKMLAKDRKTLRQQRAKKDSTIARLRAKIASLEATIQAHETQLREMEEEGEDIHGGAAFLSDDDDFEEDENTDVEDYEFMDAGEDDYIPIDVDDE
ncbi:hypothetical protein QYE76_029256 [Lolium multiflorum]|uniref:Uncharacterized protein n=1 Tax=Lolium multiflorum TaxID=4521 RepID=A0AAD8VI38_LOLMU|nr:hypothetical protein QYE76_029256 [Lolium multiflorum]